jgi:hypothetical protein
MAARPQTLYGIADSPVGLAAWLLDHNDADGQPAAAIAAALTGTRALTNTGASASRSYWQYKGGFFNATGVSIPVGVSVFPGERYQAPRSWAEQAYPRLIYYNQADKGGHFAAWEQPKLFAEEMRVGFGSLRTPRVPEPSCRLRTLRHRDTDRAAEAASRAIAPGASPS